MKCILPTVILLALALCNSCVTSKTYSTEEIKMRDTSAGTYILTTSGEKISGQSISLPSAFVLNKNYIKLDGTKYMNINLSAYQDKNAYYKIFRRSGGDVWVKQLKRGKINLYTYETVPDKRSRGGTNTQYRNHFVFEKEGAGIPLAELSLEDIAAILKDNQKAYDVFTAQFGSKDRRFMPKVLDTHPEVIMKAVDIYNGNE